MNDVIRHLWKPSRQSRLGIRSTPRAALTVWDAIKANGYPDLPTPDWTQGSFIDWVIKAAIQLSRGLAASHAKGYVHCDLKPSNVLITTEGQPVLIDFNVAFKHNANQSPGNVGGTLPYMAPEQIRAFSGRGYADIGAQTDVFGLGATLYQLLTGTMPFDAEMSAADGIRALLQSRQVTPKPMRAFNPEIGERLERLIMKCLNYEVGARPQNTLEVARELEYIQELRRMQFAKPARTSVMDRRRIGVALALAGSALAAVAVHEQIDRDAKLAEGQTAVATTSPKAALPDEPQRKSRPIAEILMDGLDDLRQGSLDAAEAKFAQAVAIDPQHQGAKIGLARAKAQLKKVAEAEQLLGEIQWPSGLEPAEILAFRAYCGMQMLNTNRRIQFDAAIRHSEAAIQQGFSEPRMLTNLAYCYYFSPQTAAKSVELLERARMKAPNLPETNLLLASAYWQCRTNSGVPLGQFDLQYLSEVWEAPPRKAATCWYLADMFSAFASTQSTSNPQLCSEFSSVAVDFFERACELNWDRNMWNHIRPRLSPGIRSQAEARFADVPEDAKPSYPKTCVLILDPLHNTRFDRVLPRQLAVGEPLTASLEK